MSSVACCRLKSHHATRGFFRRMGSQAGHCDAASCLFRKVGISAFRCRLHPGIGPWCLAKRRPSPGRRFAFSLFTYAPRTRASCHAALSDTLIPILLSLSCKTGGPFPLLSRRQPVFLLKLFSKHHERKLNTRSRCSG